MRVDYWYPKGQNPHLGPDPRCPQVLKPHPSHPIIKKGCDSHILSSILMLRIAVQVLYFYCDKYVFCNNVSYTM